MNTARAYAVLRGIRRGLVVSSLTLSVSFLAVICTPISEWLAEPLRVEEDPQSSDVIIVLGAFASRNGILNESALRRTIKAAELYHQSMAPTVLITGGNEGRPEGEHTAEHMAALARRLGVPSEALIVETESRSTRDNAQRSQVLFDARGFQSAVLVSDMAHLYRARALFHFVPRLHTIASDRFRFYWTTPEIRLSRFRAVVYEYVALLHYRWQGWL
ncbi:MAG: YdcF family protein [Myxococcota bacterium]